MEDKKSFLFRNILVLFSLIFLSLFLIILLFSVIFYIFFYPNSPSPQNTPHRYKSTEINIIQNFTKYSTVQIPREISPGEHISYNDPQTGSHFIIAPFEESEYEYECSGSCFCSGDDRRTPSVSVLTRGVSFLLSALTTATAMKFADETLQEHCAQFARVCDEDDDHSSRVSSKVDNCVKFDRSGFEEYVHCQGFCLQNDLWLFRVLRLSLPDLQYLSIGEKEFGECEKMGLKHSFEKKKVEYVKGKHEDFVLERFFAQEVLGPYCEKNTEIEYIGTDAFEIPKAIQNFQDSEKKPSEEAIKWVQQYGEFFPYCIGYINPGFEKDGEWDFSNIDCFSS